MHFIIYSSYALPGLTGAELKALLANAREKNKARSITGMLLYFDEKFLQLIEGEENDVKNLYNIILKDKRHYSVVKLKEGHVETRFFEDWSMGYKAISQTGFTGFEADEHISKPDAINTSSALKLFKILSAKTEV